MMNETEIGGMWKTVTDQIMNVLTAPVGSTGLIVMHVMIVILISYIVWVVVDGHNRY